MNVVYFAVGEEHAALAELSAQALRATNPDAKAYVLTDLRTQFKTLEPVRGHCSQDTLMYDRTIAQLHFLRQHREALFLDSDCVVQRDLTGAFQGPMAVTKRVPPKDIPEQIYNGGVLYGEGRAAVAFWAHFVEVYQYLQRDAWAWYGDQVILSKIVPLYAGVNVYEAQTHNLVLSRFDQSTEDAYIVHFKGKRKPWMGEFVARITDEVSA